jgi:hypothetical protein
MVLVGAMCAELEEVHLHVTLGGGRHFYDLLYLRVNGT